MPADAPLHHEVVFGAADRPAIKIIPHHGGSGQRGPAIPAPHHRHLSDLIAEATRGLAGIAVTNSRGFLLVFSPEVQQNLANNTYSLMEAVRGGYRANAVNAAGHIVEPGRLIRPTSINPAMAGLVVWQVLTVVTAQKHLADISMRLSELEAGIQDVAARLDNDRRAWVRSNYEYLLDIVQLVRSGRLVPEEVPTLNSQLEMIERESNRVMLSLEAEMDHQLNSFVTLDLSGTKMQDGIAQVRERMSQFTDRAQEYLLAVNVRAIGAWVKSALPVERSLAIARIERLVDKLRGHEHRDAQFLVTLCQHVPALGSRIQKLTDHLERVAVVTGPVPGVLVKHGTSGAKRTVNVAQDELEHHIRYAFSRLRTQTGQVTSLVAQTASEIRQRCSEADQPLVLEALLDGKGQIRALHQISNVNLPRAR